MISTPYVNTLIIFPWEMNNINELSMLKIAYLYIQILPYLEFEKLKIPERQMEAELMACRFICCWLMFSVSLSFILLYNCIHEETYNLQIIHILILIFTIHVLANCCSIFGTSNLKYGLIGPYLSYWIQRWSVKFRLHLLL